MSANEVEALVRLYIAALGGQESLEPFLSTDATFTVGGARWMVVGGPQVGAAVRHHYREEFDARAELIRLAVHSRGAAAELRFIGTHVGDYEGIPATGRTVDVPMSMWFDVAERRISAIRVYYSPDGVLAQLRESTV